MSRYPHSSLSRATNEAQSQSAPLPLEQVTSSPPTPPSSRDSSSSSNSLTHSPCFPPPLQSHSSPLNVRNKDYPLRPRTEYNNKNSPNNWMDSPYCPTSGCTDYSIPMAYQWRLESPSSSSKYPHASKHPHASEYPLAAEYPHASKCPLSSEAPSCGSNAHAEVYTSATVQAAIAAACLSSILEGSNALALGGATCPHGGASRSPESKGNSQGPLSPEGLSGGLSERFSGGRSERLSGGLSERFSCWLSERVSVGLHTPSAEEEESKKEILPAKKLRRLASNRESARRSRERKHERLQELEVLSVKLKEEQVEMQRRLEEVHEELEYSERLSNDLKAQLAMLKRMCEGSPREQVTRPLIMLHTDAGKAMEAEQQGPLNSHGYTVAKGSTGPAQDAPGVPQRNAERSKLEKDVIPARGVHKDPESCESSLPVFVLPEKACLDLSEVLSYFE